MSDERASLACRFCGKEFSAVSVKAAWNRVSGHELGAHVADHPSGPDHVNWVDHPHGNWQRYRKGCRCAACRSAHAKKARDEQRKSRARRNT